MSVAMMREKPVMEMKKIAISAKRQITIPQKFFSTLGFDTEAECMIRGNELVIRPVKTSAGGEFAEQILTDLIKQGYSGDELLFRFKEAQSQVRPAVEGMLEEAKRAATAESPFASYNDVFGMEDEG